MLDMSTWQVRTFDVTKDLRLDPHNVRLGVQLSADPPQADIIQDLFQHEGALEIARSIMSVGFLTHERPVVVRENDLWIVAEGNRRTAALKALLNPYLVPAAQPRLAELVDETPVPARFQRVECLIAPDRDAANQLIATLHTANARKPWGPLRQAEFFAAQLTAGKSVEELIATYPGIRVADFVKTADMHRLLQTANFEDDEVARYARRRNFPISTFERLYQNPDFLKLARMSVDDKTGRVSLQANQKDFDRVAEKIVTDIKTKRINTRVLNAPGDESYQEYLRELTAMKIGPGVTTKAANRPEVKLPPPKVRASPTLDVSGLHPMADFPAIGSILNELSNIRYRDFPNATFDLIRSFLEKSVKAYAESKNEAIPKRGQYVFLDSALEWLQDEIVSSDKKSLLQVIRKLRQNEKFNVYAYGLTADYLNAANHNHQIFIEPGEVLNLWNSIINLLRYVLRESDS